MTESLSVSLAVPCSGCRAGPFPAFFQPVRVCVAQAAAALAGEAERQVSQHPAFPIPAAPTTASYDFGERGSG